VGALFGALTALSIGLSDLFARHVVNRRGAIVASVVVQGVGVAASLVMVTMIASELDAADLAIGFASGLGLGVGLWGYLSGLSVSSAAVVSPIVATMSAVVPFTYALARGASASGWSIVGAVVAIAGLVLISSSGGRVANVAEGVRWSVISGLGYGFGLSIIIDASDEGGAWPAVTQRFGALVLMVTMALVKKGGLPLLGVRLTGLLAGVFAALSTVWYLLGLAADETPAVVTASMFPAVTVLIGRFVYHDTVTRLQVVGLAVVLLGVVGVVAL
jgi:drug/metabolite transporter (DMT)-like permease